MDADPRMARFREFLSGQGLKFTRQRQAIAEVFYESGEHLSLNELLERAKTRHAGVGYATVYRTMKLMADSGLASEHRFHEGHTRYEPAEDGEHHDHIICIRCGRIVEFEDDAIERIQDQVAKRHGFRAISHRHEIYGECEPRCAP